ncbi:MAG: FtsX-like permease family protein [Rhodospirillales bacterium]|nr:FtsX-like permease family protein [Rhodospirillales bacterium]
MSELALSWRLARRELRAGFGRFRILLACLILGVAAITAVGNLSESVLGGLRADGKKLLGGDIDLRLYHRPVAPEQLEFLKARSRAFSETITMRAMVRPETSRDKRAMVELKAVDAAYPLVGQLQTAPASPAAATFALVDGAWGATADANLLTRLDLKLGDRIKLGGISLQLRSRIESEPDRVASVFSLGPRLMIGLDALHQSGLVQPGSQLHYHYKLTLDERVNTDAWQEALARQFPQAGWRLRTPEEAAPGIKRFLERMTLFLSFTGLTVLLVGGLGITGAVRSYLDTKTETIATFKCLGAPGSLVFSIYMMQVLVIGGIGIIAGLLIGGAGPVILLELVGDQLPVRPAIGVYAAPTAIAAVFGLLATVTFALWPLGRARDVSAAQLFRFSLDTASRRPRMGYVVAMAVGSALLALCTLLTASNQYFAAWFIGGSVLTLVLLRLGALLIMTAARSWKPDASALWRLVQTNLYRPGTPTPNLVVSLGLGLTVLVAIGLIEGNLSRQISERLPERAPAFFFLDIQPDQVARFDQAVTAIAGTGTYKRVPSLRGRIVKINGTPVEEADVAAESQWAVRGDRALTYAASKDDVASDVTKGEWWPAGYAGPPLISLDAGLARGFHVDVGDSLTLNVLGREITARIASLREIDWRSLQFDFAIVFAPGVLEGAPHSHIAAIEATAAVEDAVERAATDGFPNISAIRVRDALQAAATILAGIGAAVKGTAALTLVAGLIVLAGIMASEHRRRVYEAVIFKVLGAGSRRVLYIYLLEYGVLGLLTGLVAAAIGTLTAWAVITFLMRAEWIFLPQIVATTVFLCVVMTSCVGLIGTWRVLGQKASPHLRNE